MMNSLRKHPFAVEAFFESSHVFTFAVPKEEIAPLIPPCLTPDIFDEEWAFIAVAMVQANNLRPKGFPPFLGNNFFLVGYRVFVRYTNNEGKHLRGLYILRSETDKKLMEKLGNLFTTYKYQTVDILRQHRNGIETISSTKAGFSVQIQAHSNNGISLPNGSPFTDWKQARRFAGPLPFTFSFDEKTSEVVIVQGVRENWIPQPLCVLSYSFPFITSLNFSNVVLANAFVIKNIPYHWNKGQTEHWKNENKYQGVWNVMRFNWHYYLFAATFIFISLIATLIFPAPYKIIAGLICVAFLILLLISIFVTYYIYDLSNLYSLDWLEIREAPKRAILNIHAGFDETSTLLQQKYGESDLTIADFYDPKRHTEISIKRARRAYPPHPKTIEVLTHRLPFANDQFDTIFTILSAHEIRDVDERVGFFAELGRILNPNGSIVVTEHLRDLPNFWAYNLGCLHFFSCKSWKKTFLGAGLTIVETKKVTPFITTFILQKDGTKH